MQVNANCRISETLLQNVSNNCYQPSGFAMVHVPESFYKAATGMNGARLNQTMCREQIPLIIEEKFETLLSHLLFMVPKIKFNLNNCYNLFVFFL
jgi:hypothetical protein